LRRSLSILLALLVVGIGTIIAVAIVFAEAPNDELFIVYATVALLVATVLFTAISFSRGRVVPLPSPVSTSPLG
jgi:hypothetical protein